MIFQQAGLDYNSAIDKIYELNEEAVDEYRKVQSSNNKKLRKEGDYSSVYMSNKGKLGLIDETWHDITTGEKLRDNQVVSEYAIAEKAAKTDLTPKQYRDFLIKKGIYITK
jgi:hypothetical protein